jgi:hypothetical protein
MSAQNEHNPAELWQNLSAAIIRFREAIATDLEMLRFSLKYEGELKSTTDRRTRVADKNRLRWHFSDQLEALLCRGDFSRIQTRNREPDNETGNGITLDLSKIGGGEIKGVYYIPVIDRTFIAVCSLAIRLDRSERPGSLFEHGNDGDGDLDNRLKTLLDALRVPHNENEARQHETEPNKRTCVCLFEDDSMVTALNIETRPSLRPLPRGHVELTIDVEIRTHDLIFDPD